MSTRSAWRRRIVTRAPRMVAIVFAASAAIVLLLTGVPAGPPPVPQVVGDWDGFYIAIALGGPDTRPVALSIDDQHQRRVSGELSIGDPNEIGDPNLIPGCDYPVSGGIKQKDNIVLGGDGCGADIGVHAGLLDFGRGARSWTAHWSGR